MRWVLPWMWSLSFPGQEVWYSNSRTRWLDIPLQLWEPGMKRKTSHSGLEEHQCSPDPWCKLYRWQISLNPGLIVSLKGSLRSLVYWLTVVTCVLCCDVVCCDQKTNRPQLPLVLPEDSMLKQKIYLSIIYHGGNDPHSGSPSDWVRNTSIQGMARTWHFFLIWH